jgi:hypothetical protein
MIKFLHTAVLGSWQTTAAGIVFAVVVAINPILVQNRWPTALEWTIIVSSIIKGLLAKDHNKVGTGQLGDPVRGTPGPATARQVDSQAGIGPVR